MIAPKLMNKNAVVGIAAKERRERKEERGRPMGEAADTHPLGKCRFQPLLSFFAFLAFFCGSTNAEPGSTQRTIHG